MSFAEQVTREVNDCKMAHVVRKTAKIAFTYSKLAAVIVRFKVIGEPTYPDTLFEFSYADTSPEPYEQLEDEMVEQRPDLVMLGRNMQQVREEQTAAFTEMGFTRRPKSIRSLVATILVYCRIKKQAKAAVGAAQFGDEAEERKE